MQTRVPGMRAGLVFALLTAMTGFIGCGGPSGNSDAGTDMMVMPGESYEYVTTSLTMPTQTTTIGLDLDGDGVVDNALGSLLAFLPTIPGLDSFDAQMSIDETLVDGGLVLLWRVNDVNSFTTDSDITMEVFVGDEACDAMGMNCTDLTSYTGGGAFDISASSPMIAPSEGGVGNASCLGMFGSGELRTCPGTLPLPIPLSEIQPGVMIDLEVNLESASIACDSFNETNLMSCTMGGAITEDEINNELVPTIVDVVNTLITDEAILDPMTMATVPCTSDNTTIGDHTSTTCAALSMDGVCSASNGTDMGICVDSTASVVEFALADNFDTNGNGTLEALELDPILGLVLVPDLDLDGDGVNDAISIGVAFEAAEATIN